MEGYSVTYSDKEPVYDIPVEEQQTDSSVSNEETN